MKEWFRAFKDQNETHRNYLPYFTPVLCYLEAGWFHQDMITTDMFHSDRHQMPNVTFQKLYQQATFTAYTGRKQAQENLAQLPARIYKVLNDSVQIEQWNYRIRCHLLNEDLKTDRFRAVNDVQIMMRNRIGRSEYIDSVNAHFLLNNKDAAYSESRHVKYKGELLDDFMNQIPGFNNYGASFTDDSFLTTAQTYAGDGNLNAGYYHRWYQDPNKGAMGGKYRIRGFKDRNLFYAMTDHPEVVPTEAELCSDHEGTNCQWYSQRWTYALPLEIIYLSPLTNWNPYNIVYKGDPDSEEGQTVTAGPRNGGDTLETAYNGSHARKYSITPEYFFGDEFSSDPADTTSKNPKGVLNADGQLVLTKETGPRMFIPVADSPNDILIRMRYPIIPVSGEGSNVWKELEGLKDVVLYPDDFNFMIN